MTHNYVTTHTHTHTHTPPPPTALSIPLVYFPFIHLKVQIKDVEIVKIYDTMYLLYYSCQITQYNFKMMIT